MSQYSYSDARQTMVDSHIKTWNVSDKNIQQAFGKVPRERFVAKSATEIAYADAMVDIGSGEVGLPPRILARAIQALAIKPTDSVLQVGAGTGYGALILGMLGQHVTGVELHPDLAKIATKNVADIGQKNINIQVGNAANGWSSGGPYDVIFACGAYYKLPESLKSCLRPGGRIFAFCGEAPAMLGVLITRNQQSFDTKVFFECTVPYLKKISQPEPFKF